MKGDPERGRRLQASAIGHEDMSERTVAAARRWIRAHETLLAAVEQTFRPSRLEGGAKQLYERRVEGYREHARYWHDVLAEMESEAGRR